MGWEGGGVGVSVCIFFLSATVCAGYVFQVYDFFLLCLLCTDFFSCTFISHDFLAFPHVPPITFLMV